MDEIGEVDFDFSEWMVLDDDDGNDQIDDDDDSTKANDSTLSTGDQETDINLPLPTKTPEVQEKIPEPEIPENIIAQTTTSEPNTNISTPKKSSKQKSSNITKADDQVSNVNVKSANQNATKSKSIMCQPKTPSSKTATNTPVGPRVQTRSNAAALQKKSEISDTLSATSVKKSDPPLDVDEQGVVKTSDTSQELKQKDSESQAGVPDTTTKSSKAESVSECKSDLDTTSQTNTKMVNTSFTSSCSSVSSPRISIAGRMTPSVSSYYSTPSSRLAVSAIPAPSKEITSTETTPQRALPEISPAEASNVNESTIVKKPDQPNASSVTNKPKSPKSNPKQPTQTSPKQQTQPSAKPLDQANAKQLTQPSPKQQTQPSAKQQTQPSAKQLEQSIANQETQPSPKQQIQPSAKKPTQSSVNQQTQPSPKKQTQPSAKQQTQPSPKQQTQPSAKQQTQPSPKQHAQPSAKQHAQPSPKQQTQPSAKQHAQPSPKQQTQPSAKQHAQPSPKQQTQPSAKQHTQPNPKQQTQSSAKQHTPPSPKQQTQPSAKQHTQPSPKQHAQPSAKQHAQPSAKQQTQSSTKQQIQSSAGQGTQSSTKQQIQSSAGQGTQSSTKQQIQSSAGQGTQPCTKSILNTPKSHTEPKAVKIDSESLAAIMVSVEKTNALAKDQGSNVDPKNASKDTATKPEVVTNVTSKKPELMSPGIKRELAQSASEPVKKKAKVEEDCIIVSVEKMGSNTPPATKLQPDGKTPNAVATEPTLKTPAKRIIRRFHRSTQTEVHPMVAAEPESKVVQCVPQNMVGACVQVGSQYKPNWQDEIRYMKPLPESVLPNIFKIVSEFDVNKVNERNVNTDVYKYGISIGQVFISNLMKSPFKENVLLKADYFNTFFSGQDLGIVDIFINDKENFTNIMTQIRKVRIGNRHAVVTISINLDEEERDKTCPLTTVKATIVFDQNFATSGFVLLSKAPAWNKPKAEESVSIHNIPGGVPLDFLKLLVPDAITIDLDEPESKFTTSGSRVVMGFVKKSGERLLKLFTQLYINHEYAACFLGLVHADQVPELEEIKKQKEKWLLETEEKFPDLSICVKEVVTVPRNINEVVKNIVPDKMQEGTAVTAGGDASLHGFGKRKQNDTGDLSDISDTSNIGNDMVPQKVKAAAPLRKKDSTRAQLESMKSTLKSLSKPAAKYQRAMGGAKLKPGFPSGPRKNTTRKSSKERTLKRTSSKERTESKTKTVLPRARRSSRERSPRDKRPMRDDINPRGRDGREEVKENPRLLRHDKDKLDKWSSPEREERSRERYLRERRSRERRSRERRSRERHSRERRSEERHSRERRSIERRNEHCSNERCSKERQSRERIASEWVSGVRRSLDRPSREQHSRVENIQDRHSRDESEHRFQARSSALDESKWSRMSNEGSRPSLSYDTTGRAVMHRGSVEKFSHLVHGKFEWQDLRSREILRRAWSRSPVRESARGRSASPRRSPIHLPLNLGRTPSPVQNLRRVIIRKSLSPVRHVTVQPQQGRMGRNPSPPSNFRPEAKPSREYYSQQALSPISAGDDMEFSEPQGGQWLPQPPGSSGLSRGQNIQTISSRFPREMIDLKKPLMTSVRKNPSEERKPDFPSESGKQEKHLTDSRDLLTKIMEKMKAAGQMREPNLNKAIEVSTQFLEKIKSIQTSQPSPESRALESRAPERRAPESRALESRAPERRAPESRALESRAPESRALESRAPERRAPESRAPESRALESRPLLLESRPPLLESRPSLLESRPPLLESRPPLLESRATTVQSIKTIDSRDTRPTSMESYQTYPPARPLPILPSYKWSSQGMNMFTGPSQTQPVASSNPGPKFPHQPIPPPVQPPLFNNMFSSQDRISQMEALANQLASDIQKHQQHPHGQAAMQPSAPQQAPPAPMPRMNQPTQLPNLSSFNVSNLLSMLTQGRLAAQPLGQANPTNNMNQQNLNVGNQQRILNSGNQQNLNSGIQQQNLNSGNQQNLNSGNQQQNLNSGNQQNLNQGWPPSNYY